MPVYDIPHSSKAGAADFLSGVSRYTAVCRVPKERPNRSARSSNNRAQSRVVRAAYLSALALQGFACSLSDAHAAPEGRAAPALNVNAEKQEPGDTPLPAAAASAHDPLPASDISPQIAAHVSSEGATDAAPNTERVWTVEELLALPGSHSTSIGGPSAGRIEGALPLPDEGPGFYHNTKRPYGARFGSVELVQSIMRAAANTAQKIPDSLLTVNDLGLLEGGPIHEHGSHQAGRDADILFFSVDARGKPIPSVGVPIDPSGGGVDFKDLRDPKDDQPIKLDVKRTWRFAAELIEVADVNLQRIFIVEHVRQMLLDEAARVHAPKAVVQRFADITCQPETPHDDHMHIRLFCTPEDMARGCMDSPPVYPYRVTSLAEHGLKPLIMSLQQALAERRARKARTTTPEQAKKKAGPMHARVTAFLKQREAWLKKPSPGRPYCK
jgi:penicillin-insensitive murein DD-endopeptidase